MQETELKVWDARDQSIRRSLIDIYIQNCKMSGMSIIRVWIKFHTLSYRHSLADDFFSICDHGHLVIHFVGLIIYSFQSRPIKVINFWKLCHLNYYWSWKYDGKETHLYMFPNKITMGIDIIQVSNYW